MPLNLYTIFVGPPATGKSQALKDCTLKPISALQDDQDLGDVIIQKYTSSGLVKTISQQEKGFLLSAEIYDELHKLLKSDEESAKGDVQVMCEMFSGERTSYRYATEKVREIAENTPFSILGSTQIPFVARIISQLDQGHGLLDRFLFTFPKCVRPPPQATDQATDQASLEEDCPIKSTSDIFVEMRQLCANKATYTFDEDANALLKCLHESCITEINQAIEERRTPPKSKKADLVQRVAVAIHMFVHVTHNLLSCIKPDMPPLAVSLNTLESAIAYVEWVESQKEIFVQVRPTEKKCTSVCFLFILNSTS